MIVFLHTASGSRGIYASFPICSREQFIQSVKDRRYGYGRWRYCNLGDHAQMLSSMDIVEFDRVFPTNPFTPEEIDDLFNVKVRRKYGVNLIKPNFKAIPKAELQRGGEYKDVDGCIWIYLGYGTQITQQLQGNFEETSKSGYAYHLIRNGRKSLDFTNMAYPETLVKTPKRLKEFTGVTHKLPESMDGKFTYLANQYYKREKYTMTYE